MKNKIKNSKKPRKKTKKSEKKEEKLEEEIKEAEEAITHRLRETQQHITHRLRETLNDEKEIEEDEIFEQPVRQIPAITEISAPVLERIIQREIPQQIPPEIEPEKETREEGRINYTATNEPNYGFARNTEDEEKKYETAFVPPVLTRREFSEEGMRREFLKPPENVWNTQSNERQLSEIDFIEQETRLPFEEQQKKYKRAKLR